MGPALSRHTGCASHPPPKSTALFTAILPVLLVGVLRAAEVLEYYRYRSRSAPPGPGLMRLVNAQSAEPGKL